MDLLSLDGGERYHTLAALTHIVQPQGEFLLLGLFPDDRHDRISRVMHEATHVGSLRTTRLGFWIARVASLTLHGKRQIPEGPLEVPPDVEPVLGAFSPFLEGLALYGQLDYETENVEGILPFTLNKIAENNTSAALTSGGTLRAMRLAKCAAMWGGMLTELFLNLDTETEHYFAGYLYVKAVIAKLAGIEPSLAEPTTALPLLVRLVCDHPILDQAASRVLSANDVFDGILETIRDLSADDIRRIQGMLQREDVRNKFDNWDIYAQLKSNRNDPIILHGEDNPLFATVSETDLFEQLRGATSVHLSSWTAGTATGNVDFKNSEACFELLNDAGDKTDVRIVYLSLMDRVREGLNHESLETLEEFEKQFYSNLVLACRSKQPLAIGSYITLTRGSAGMVIWRNHELAGLIPLSLLDNRLDPSELSVAEEGLKLSPVFRRHFAHALRSSDAQAIARGQADDAIMATLVGSPKLRTMLLRGGLASPLSRELKQQLSHWCERALKPGGNARPEPEVLTALTKIFDRPGFNPGPFDDLLPNLIPVERFLRGIHGKP